MQLRCMRTGTTAAAPTGRSRWRRWSGPAVLFSTLLAAAVAKPAAAADSPPSGEALFKRNCGTCHVISQTPAKRQGPNLYGVVGRHAGRLDGFTYSEALKNAELVWTDATLDAWLTDASKFVPGSVMPYRQADPAVRSAIIDYLKSAGGGGSTAADAPKSD